MMINSFQNYVNMGRAKKQTPDPEECKSLFEKAKNRLKYSQSKKITSDSAAFVLEDAYEAIRESAQSLMSLKGFKPYSHEATISFIREYYPDAFTEYDIKQFDRFRMLRNDSVYKAIEIVHGDAADCISFASKFLDKVTAILVS